MLEYKHAPRPFWCPARSLSQPGACVYVFEWVFQCVLECAQVDVAACHFTSVLLCIRSFCFEERLDVRSAPADLAAASEAAFSAPAFIKVTRVHVVVGEQLVSQNEYVVYLLFSIPVLF